MNVQEMIAREGFRTGSTLNKRVLEAARLFRAGVADVAGLSAMKLKEAFTTSDFPTLLGLAFEKEALQAEKDYTPEWPQIADEYKVKDFRPKKLLDLFGTGFFDDVAEGEEYKGQPLKELAREIRVGKTGASDGITFETLTNWDFTSLIDFPKRYGRKSGRTADKKVFEVFVSETGPNTDFFDTVDNKPLTADNLQAAIEAMALKRNHHDELVDTTNLILVVPPSLAVKAKQIVTSEFIEITEGNKRVRQQNPFQGLVTVHVSRMAAELNKSATMGTTWYLFPKPGSDNPALAKVTMLGHENLEVRVKKDQGTYAGGGDVPVEQGSFDDDTIWYRGRLITGGAEIFNYATYASTGA